VWNPAQAPFLTVEASPDLAAWAVLTNVISATNAVTVSDPTSVDSPVRFYRARIPE
jgi:hypothetical protein